MIGTVAEFRLPSKRLPLRSSWRAAPPCLACLFTLPSSIPDQARNLRPLYLHATRPSFYTLVRIASAPPSFVQQPYSTWVADSFVARDRSRPPLRHRGLLPTEAFHLPRTIGMCLLSCQRTHNGLRLANAAFIAEARASGRWHGLARAQRISAGQDCMKIYVRCRAPIRQTGITFATSCLGRQQCREMVT